MARTKQRARKQTGGRPPMRATKKRVQAVQADANKDEEDGTQSVVSRDEGRDSSTYEEDDDESTFGDDEKAPTPSPVTDRGLCAGEADIDKASSDLSDVSSALKGGLGRLSKLTAKYDVWADWEDDMASLVKDCEAINGESDSATSMKAFQGDSTPTSCKRPLPEDDNEAVQRKRQAVETVSQPGQKCESKIENNSTMQPPTIPPWSFALPAKDSSDKHQLMPSANDSNSEMQEPVSALKGEHQLSSQADISRKMIDDFRAGTKSNVSEEVVQQFLDAAGGNLVLAARSYDKASKSVQPAEVTAQEPPSANLPSLVEQALAAMAKSKKPRKDIGDVLIVLNGQDLGRSLRLSSDDLRSASTLFRETMDEAGSTFGSTDPVNGVQFVCILERPAEKNGLPLLCRKALDILQQDCKNDFYTQVDVKIKPEAAHQDLDLMIDWLDAYGIFFRVVSRLPVRFLEKGTLDKTLPKLENIAHISNYYRAVGTRSPVTREIDNLFRRYILDGVLWKAIAKEPARWLMLAIQLENEMVFKEAFVHLAGKYPDRDHDGQASVTIPENIMENIKTKSRDLYYHRKDIDSQLLTFIVQQEGQHPCALAAMDTWRNWVGTHIRIMAREGTQPLLISRAESLLCGSKVPLASLNTFYTALSKGGDAYLPAEEARSYYRKNYPTAGMDILAVRMFNEAFGAMKTGAKTIVKSLVQSSLNGGCDGLEYLTCTVVEDEDIPWEREVKDEDGGAGDDDDDDMQF